MCARPEPTEYYQPLVDLHAEFRTWQNGSIVDQTSWVGSRTLLGLLENA